MRHVAAYYIDEVLNEKVDDSAGGKRSINELGVGLRPEYDGYRHGRQRHDGLDDG